MHFCAFVVAFAFAGGGVSTSPTTSSRQFVPNCRIILFGEALEQVSSDDGKTLGARFERTEDAILINGRVWLSKDDKPKEVIRTEQSAETERRGAVMEEAARQFRSQQKKAGEGRYSVSGTIYSETPRPFHVARYDKTVDLAVKGCATCMPYIYVTYEGSALGMPLNPEPTPSQEEQDKQRLDNAFRMALNHARAGTIIFVSYGQFTPHPLEKADAFISAMRKVPSLAVPVAKDIYGEMAYRSLTVDGFFFDPDMVAVIIKAEQRREQ